MRRIDPEQANAPRPNLTDQGPGPAQDDGMFLDMLKGVGRGIEDTAYSIYDLADFATGDNLPDSPEDSVFGEASTTAGKVTEAATQFLSAFVPIAGWVGKGAKALKWGTSAASKIGQGAIAGGITDFLAFRANEERLSNLIQDIPQLANPVTAFLAAGDDDHEIIGRLKNTIEGLGLGAVTDGLLMGLKAAKFSRQGVAEGVTEENASAYIAKKLAEDPVAAKAGLGNTKFMEGIQKQIAEAGDEVDVKKLIDDEITLVGREARAYATREIAKSVSGGSIDHFKTGRINAKLGASVVDHIKGTADIEAIMAEQEKVIVAKWGGKGSQRTPAMIKEEADAFRDLADWSNQPENVIRADMRDAVEDEVAAGVRAVAIRDLYVHTMIESNHLLEIANKSGDAEDLARYFHATRKAMAVREFNSAMMNAQGTNLNARKFNPNDLDELAMSTKATIKMAGGMRYLKKMAKIMGEADTFEQYAKVTGEMKSKGGRWFRAHNEYWINALLSGPKTHVVNMLGNSLNTVFLPAERAVGGLLTADTQVMKASFMHYGALAEFAKDSLKLSLQSWKGGDGILNHTSKMEGFMESRSISGENLGGGGAMDWLGKMLNTPVRLLIASDEFFKQINYRAAAKVNLYHRGMAEGMGKERLEAFVEDGMSKLLRESGARFSENSIHEEALTIAAKEKMRGAKKIEFVRDYVKKNFDETKSHLKEVSEQSNEYANEVTFTSDLRDGSAPMRIQQLVNEHPTFQLVVPFVRTPTNILKWFGQRVMPYTGEHGDIPILKSIHKRAAEDMASGDPMRIAAVKGRMATGSAMMLTAAELAHSGLITGNGPEDPEEQAVWRAAGNQPYSFKIGDKWHSYQRLDPFATFFGMASDMVTITQRNDQNTASSVELIGTAGLMALQNNIANKSYLTGLADVFKALSEPERYGMPVVKKYLGSEVPAFVAQLKGTMGDDALNEVHTISDAIKNRVPSPMLKAMGLAPLEPRRNILGEPVKREVGAVDFINPFAQTSLKDDEVFEELKNLQHGFQPPSPMLYRQFDLTAYQNDEGQTAYDRYQELMGTTRVKGKSIRQALSRLIHSPKYKKLPEPSFTGENMDLSGHRRNAVRREMAQFRKKAEEQMLREYPELNERVRRYKTLNGLAGRGLISSAPRIDDPSSGNSLLNLLD